MSIKSTSKSTTEATLLPYNDKSRESYNFFSISKYSRMLKLLIPLSYLAYYKVASLLFEDNREKIGPFMVIIAAVSMFGGASFYTKETFFLTRIWQGKSLVISFMIPVVTYLLLLLAKHSGKQYVSKRRIFGIYFVMFIANIACALMSSLGLFLVLMYTHDWGRLAFLVTCNRNHPQED